MATRVIGWRGDGRLLADIGGGKAVEVDLAARAVSYPQDIERAAQKHWHPYDGPTNHLQLAATVSRLIDQQPTRVFAISLGCSCVNCPDACGGDKGGGGKKDRAPKSEKAAGAKAMRSTAKGLHKRSAENGEDVRKDIEKMSDGDREKLAEYAEGKEEEARERGIGPKGNEADDTDADHWSLISGLARGTQQQWEQTQAVDKTRENVTNEIVSALKSGKPMKEIGDHQIPVQMREAANRLVQKGDKESIAHAEKIEGYLEDNGLLQGKSSMAAERALPRAPKAESKSTGDPLRDKIREGKATKEDVEQAFRDILAPGSKKKLW